MTNTITLKALQARYTAAIEACAIERKSSETVQRFLDAAVTYAFNNEGRGLNLISDLLNELQANNQYHYTTGVKLWLNAFFPISAKVTDEKWTVKTSGKRAYERASEWRFDNAAASPFNRMNRKDPKKKPFELLEWLRRQESNLTKREDNGEVSHDEAQAVIEAVNQAITAIEKSRTDKAYGA